MNILVLGKVKHDGQKKVSRGNDLLENVFATHKNERSLNTTCVTVQGRFQGIGLQPRLQGKLGFLSVSGNVAAAHFDTSMPEEERTVVQGPNCVFCEVMCDRFAREQECTLEEI